MFWRAQDPSVDHRLHGVAKPIALNAAHQAIALLDDTGRPFAHGDQHHVAPAVGQQRFELAGGFERAEQVGALGNGGDEVPAGLGGVGFEFGFIHGVFIDCFRM